MNKTLKSILSLVLCVCFVLALSACGKQNNDTTANNTDTNVSNNNVTDDNTDDSADITPEESTAGDSNILVAYFSWSGNTQQVANWISDKTGGELFRIIPEVEYTEDDVFDRAQDELNNGTRPPLSSHIDQEVMEQYDVIFVGFPIWLAYHKLIQCTQMRDWVHFKFTYKIHSFAPAIGRGFFIGKRKAHLSRCGSDVLQMASISSRRICFCLSVRVLHFEKSFCCSSVNCASSPSAKN